MVSPLLTHPLAQIDPKTATTSEVVEPWEDYYYRSLEHHVE